MGQTLFDELSLSEFKARLGREGGGGGCLGPWGWAGKITLPLMGQ